MVDDEKHMVRLMEYSLKKRGYLVDTAFNGAEALEKVNVDKPDLILLDIKMPVMNGYEVCLHLKKNPETKNIPVIIVSIFADNGETASLEVAGRIVKPFDPGKLVKQVELTLCGQSVGV